MNIDLSANAERFTGFAGCYDTNRPTPPAVIVDILTQLARVKEPNTVVDIGCGTGLSTRIWAGRASEVIGVDPSRDMLSQAKSAATELDTPTRFRFVEAFSSNTGLENECADIVTCSQSLHWMEPESTFAEVARILRSGGVFAAIDCDWPPVMDWEVEEAYRAFMKRVNGFEMQHGVLNKVTRWSKNRHLERIQQSGRFRFAQEILAHGIETGNAERMVGLALSFGGVEDVLKLGVSEEEIGLPELRAVAERVLGDKQTPWYFGYRVRIGIK